MDQSPLTVALSLSSIDIMSNGSIQVKTGPVAPPPPLPEPISDPIGWRVYPGDGQTPARVRHDSVMRETGANLQQTNEMFPLRPYDGEKIDWRSKITMPLAYRQDWLDRFRALLGPWVWERFIRKGYGWCDFDNNPTLRFNALDCGGNIRNVIDKVDGWGVVQSQNYYGWPDYTSYNDNPQLYIKQVLVFSTAAVPLGWMVDKGEVGGCGDVIIPCVTDSLAAHPLRQLEFFPALPFAATLHNQPVIVEGYCFRGSDTLVLVNGKWYLAEEMLVIGNIDNKSLGGSWLDRRTYITPWLVTCPPPVIGWTRLG